jgi:dihydrodipicolinate synthase/N-acetylneuraminate lyase
MNQLKLNTSKVTALKNGVVIPAIPLALNRNRKLDERRQRALFRYYFDAGAGGLAVAVHTTQFEIRLPEFGLFRPILELAKEEYTRFVANTNQPVIMISGVIGQTAQAVKEARLAADLGYDAVLLSLAALREASNPELLNHCRVIAEILPVIGFYLQPAVGGRKLNVDFWREFARIENVVAIKIAPFNRYQTIDVVRGVIESGRSNEIALYTGNDDNIIPDLLTEYKMSDGNKIVSKRIVGGLLGHWAVWTKKAVELLDEIHTSNNQNKDIRQLLAKGIHVTDSNAAFFDSANNFAGCITGIHEVLRRQGMLEGIWTLNEKDILSPGQKEEIDRVYKAYPELNDDAFVAENLDRWLK